MRTLEYLSGPERAIFLPAVLAGVAMALSCGLLSVLVVLRRLAFIGHGVSHAAFGGVGLAAVLGIGAASAGTAGLAAYLGVVGAFCVGAALAVGWLSARRGPAALREDTVIGITLVGSMALGALLLHASARAGGVSTSFEGRLFGSILGVSAADAWAAWAVGAAIALVMVLARRPLLFWAFDEPGARAFGVPTTAVRLLLMALLGVAVVVAMKLAGVILVTALLVIPGAAALRLSRRLAPVFAWSAGLSLLGTLGGLVLSFEADLPPGPCVVAALVAIMLGAWVWSAVAYGVPGARREAATRKPT